MEATLTVDKIPELRKLVQQIRDLGNQQRALRHRIEMASNLVEDERDDLREFHDELVDSKVKLINRYYRLTKNNLRVI